LIFTPDGKLAYAARTGYGVWDPVSREKIAWVDENGSYLRIAPSPDGQFLAVSSYGERRIRFISTDDYGTVRHTVPLRSPGYNNSCTVSAFSADGSIVVPASGYSGGVTQAEWDPGLEIVAGYNVNALAIHPKSNQIYSSYDTSIQIRAKENFAGAPGSTVNAPQTISSLAFNQTGTLLACGLADGGVELRRWADGQVSGPIARFWTGSNCFFTAFTPDSCSLVTGNSLGTAIWYLGDTDTPPADRASTQ
jgi:DNA-binding beta-propeller fold protein YncE